MTELLTSRYLYWCPVIRRWTRSNHRIPPWSRKYCLELISLCQCQRSWGRIFCLHNWNPRPVTAHRFSRLRPTGLLDCSGIEESTVCPWVSFRVSRPIALCIQAPFASPDHVRLSDLSPLPSLLRRRRTPSSVILKRDLKNWQKKLFKFKSTNSRHWLSNLSE